MNKFLASAAVIGMVFAANAPASAFDAEESRDVGRFDSISVLGFSEVFITVGEAQSVSIEADDSDDLENIITEVKNGELRVYFEKSWRDRSWGHDELVLRVSMPELTGLEVTGVGDLDVVGMDGGDLDAEIVGTGRATLEGSCDKLEIEVTGTGSLDAEGMECRVVELDVIGSGRATVFASEEIEVSSVASGSVRVYGDPDKRDVSSVVSAKVRFARK